MSSSTTTFSRATKRNAGIIGRRAAVFAAASGLVFSGALTANAADVPAESSSAPASSVDLSSLSAVPLTAASSVQISFERTAVASTPAPVVAPPAPVAAAAPAPRAAAPVAAAAPAPRAAAPAAPVAAAAPAPKAAVTVQAAPAPAVAPATGGRGAALLASAYAQVGITQDCTAMVEKALGAAGKPVGDLGPQQFLGQGTIVATPAPGDIIVQAGHVAIYAGNGQVISGGMNYVNATMVHPLSWLTATGGVTFVRVA